MLTSFRHSLRSCCSTSTRGFSLIELIVVSAIILIVSTLILLGQERFNSTTLLRSLTYSIALSVREAQVYSTSVREAGIGNFDNGYGVYVSPSYVCPNGATATCYILFSDTNNNGQRDAGDTDLSVYSLGRSYTVGNICARVTSTQAMECLNTSTAITGLNIFFRRPNPDACFSTLPTYTDTCLPAAAGRYSSAYVELRSASGSTRSIKVSSSGQISVCAPNLSNLTQC